MTAVPSAHRPNLRAPVAAKLRVVAALIITASAACGPSELDTSPAAVRAAAVAAGAVALPEPPAVDAAKAAVGALLFDEPALSGNRDIACATCHVAALATTDLVSLAIGTGGVGTGPNRVIPEDRRLYPRNTLDLANRGYPEFVELHWDGRTRPRPGGGYTEPEDWEDTVMPDGLESALAAAAIDALSDKDQMSGRAGDIAVDGTPNELGGLEDEELPLLWERIVARAVAAGHGPALAAAFGVDESALDITHVANAIAAHVASAYIVRDTDWDRFLAGDDSALTAEARRGAALFYGPADCASCHGGPHASDLEYHNIATPQVGLGQEDEEPLDYGRGRETNVPDERYRFRTPPLRNVALTGPWMHDGAYTTLEGAILHHDGCEARLRSYDRLQLKPELQGTFRNADIVFTRMLTTLDPWCDRSLGLTGAEVAALVAFLDAMSEPL
ncbi:MAG: hypothetical protein H6698_05050 [Myxococcales bacterium]|nr:hypothetical protein [Myxococcales bacterium]MCB9519731.1 hypothetical protein [Myxococcales bacterium]MCB9533669.1 hypothetical protein [Myxococcales bacterium]